MEDKGNKSAFQSISLYEKRGETSVYIDASITRAGDLQLYGQDIGSAPSGAFGDSDYEYWLTVPGEHKDRVLLLLLKRLYGGDSTAVTGLRVFLESEGIPCKFTTWV